VWERYCLLRIYVTEKTTTATDRRTKRILEEEEPVMISEWDAR